MPTWEHISKAKHTGGGGSMRRKVAAVALGALAKKTLGGSGMSEQDYQNKLNLMRAEHEHHQQSELHSAWVSNKMEELKEGRRQKGAEHASKLKRKETSHSERTKLRSNIKSHEAMVNSAGSLKGQGISEIKTTLGAVKYSEPKEPKQKAEGSGKKTWQQASTQKKPKS
jgi:chorismate synthase